MNIQQLNSTDAEKIFASFTNNQGATITTGYAVAFTNDTASNDGNKAVIVQAVSSRTFAGICESDVANNAVGRYQCYGYHGSIYFFAQATSVSLTADHACGPGTTNSLGVAPTGVTHGIGPVVLMQSVGAVVRSAGGYVEGFIRAL
jgi:hypothetical protein